jgi:HK97 family phage portal protein
MNIFWLELRRAKVETKGFAVAVSTPDLTVDGEEIRRNFSTFYKMYKTNVDVYRCIEEMKQGTMMNGWTLMSGDKEVIDKRFMIAVGDIDQLKNEIILQYKVFANVFLRKVRNIRGETIRYEVLDSRYISIVTDTDLNPVRYLYTPKNKTDQRKYEPEEIHHFRDGRNLDDSLFWFSVLSTLVYDVLADEQGVQETYFEFKNGAIPSALYVLDDNLTIDEQNLLIDKIEATLKWPKNKGKNMAIKWVKEVKVIAKDSSKSNIIEARKYATGKICAGLGVPPAILGYIEDVNRANSESQYEKFIDNTLVPLEKTLEKIFTVLAREFGDYTFSIEYTSVDKLGRQLEIIEKAVNNGIWTRNEARRYIGWGAVDSELADELTVPWTQQLLENLTLGEYIEPVNEL